MSNGKKQNIQSKSSFDLFYNEEVVESNSDNDQGDNELLADFSNKKTFKEISHKTAVIKSKPEKKTNEKNLKEQFISELSNKNIQGDSRQRITNEKKLEKDLSLRYGKGYQLLKLAGYKIGNGLGANEQGITDPLEIQLRKKNAGISQKEAYNPLGEDKKNNYLLGRKRQGKEKAFDETNEEMTHFENLLEAYLSNSPNEDTSIEKLLAKAKEFLQIENKVKQTKLIEFDTIYNKPIISKYIGKEFQLKEIINQSNLNTQTKEHNKELLIKLIEKTKAKVITYLDIYYSNRNNRVILSKLNETKADEHSQLENDYSQNNQFLAIIQSHNLEKIVDGNITAFIQEYISLYDKYPTLFKYSYNKLCLICMKKAIEYYQTQYTTLLDFLNETKATSFKINANLMKELINKSFSIYDESITNDHIFSFKKNEDNSFNEKCLKYYSYFIHEIILRYINDIVLNQWNVKEFDKFIHFFQLYKQIIPKCLMDSVSELITKKIIDFLSINVLFIPSRDDLYVHKWIHPWFDILSITYINTIEMCIQKKFLNDILAWNIEDQSIVTKLISLLLPWRTIFKDTFWEELGNKYFLPKLKFMFNLLKVNPLQQKIDSFIIMFQLIENKLIEKKKCVLILKTEFFPKWIKALNNWLKHGGISKSKIEEIQLWFKGWKELLNEHFKDDEDINHELKDALILIYNYTK